MIASSKRIPEFDGLRGVAAIVVVVSHIVAAFMPVLYFGPEGGTVLSWQGFFAMSPFFVMVSGSFAVFVFFVLSGFVIAASADASRRVLQGTVLLELFVSDFLVPCPYCWQAFSANFTCFIRKKLQPL